MNYNLYDVYLRARIYNFLM